MEYKLHSTHENERCIARIWVPVNQTEEEKQQVLKDIAQASYDMALELYKQGKLRGVATT